MSSNFGLLGFKEQQTALTFAQSGYTLLQNDVVVTVDTTGGATIVNLPSLATAPDVFRNSFYYLSKSTTDANALTIQPFFGDTIALALSLVLSSQSTVLLYAPTTGNNWLILSTEIDTVPSTAITGLTPQQILFGAANGHIQQSANLSYNETTKVLTLGSLGNIFTFFYPERLTGSGGSWDFTGTNPATSCGLFGAGVASLGAGTFLNLSCGASFFLNSAAQSLILSASANQLHSSAERVIIAANLGTEFYGFPVTTLLAKLDNLGNFLLSNAGYIEFTDRAADPGAAAAGKGRFYSKTVAGRSELFYRDSISIRQVDLDNESSFAQITVDTTTASAVFVALLSTVLTTNAGFLLITFNFGCSNSGVNNVNFFRLQVDAITQRSVATTCTLANSPQSGGLCFRVPVIAGVHTVSIQWRTNGGTAQIRPVTAPDAESAGLMVEEVAR